MAGSQYMLLFHSDGAPPLPEAEYAALFEAFVQWADDLAADGRYVDSAALTDHAQGRTVRRRAETYVLDGPFAESREAVNGFIIVAAEDIEAAAQLAEGCPALVHGWAVQVREVVPIPKPTLSGGAR